MKRALLRNLWIAVLMLMMASTFSTWKLSADDPQPKRVVPPMVVPPIDYSYDTAESYIVATTVPRLRGPDKSSRSRRVVRSAPAAGDCSGQRDRVARHFAAADVERACRVLTCESRGDVNARNGSHRGLMQIKGGTFDPEGNVAHAAQMAYTTSNGWNHWTCK